MRFLITLLFVSLFSFAKAYALEASCAPVGGNPGFSELATLNGPLQDHDFRIRLYDHEGEQNGTGRCIFFNGVADCYSKDMYGNDDELVMTVDFGKIRDLSKLTEVFEIKIHDIGDSSSMWECFIQN